MNNRYLLGLIPFCIAGITNAYASEQNIELYYSGPAAANAESGPDTQVFNDWCAGGCFPTTQFSLVDPVSGKNAGSANVWGKDTTFSADGQTLCFTEFIVYHLKKGDIYTLGGFQKTCGTYMDRALVIPKSSTDPGVQVLAGGGEGSIVGGTGKYKNITGTYNDRTFVEILRAQFGIKYYDALFFNLMPSNVHDD